MVFLFSSVNVSADCFMQDNVDAIWQSERETLFPGWCRLCPGPPVSRASAGTTVPWTVSSLSVTYNRFGGAPAEIRKDKAHFLYILPSSYFDSPSKWGHFNFLLGTLGICFLCVNIGFVCNIFIFPPLLAFDISNTLIRKVLIFAKEHHLKMIGFKYNRYFFFCF